MSKYTVFSTAMGWMGFVSTEQGIYASILPRKIRSDAETELLKRCPNRPELSPEAFDSLEGQVIDYLNGENINWNCRIDWSWATPFQKCVLPYVMVIPRGTILTYGEVAELAGSPLAARAVGQALAANNIPLIIPCHRVVQKNHRLGGFTGAGIETKADLLDLEGVDLHKMKLKTGG